MNPIYRHTHLMTDDEFETLQDEIQALMMCLVEKQIIYHGVAGQDFVMSKSRKKLKVSFK